VKKVGIIGCGAIGSLIARAFENGIVKCDELILCDYNPEKAAALKKSVRVQTKIVKNVQDMISLRPAIIIEAASQQAVKEHLESILAENIEVIVMSVGALRHAHKSPKSSHSVRRDRRN
jgi:aspartate dehydrogenase